ncbi:hypothetical protein J4G46_01670 [Acinetobacter towneri]|uniref:hypothetical protein n=1 Tax=Acinetobacter towneri TaxID=202956 RepID=UPI001AA0777A|nr:hypothetical protein [Acinetobacter towneri]QTD64571.1 hypothetical protein J4G46_01670 [Acinetobacter towneri]
MSKTNYDASDLYDAYSFSERDMDWMLTAIIHIRKEVKQLQHEITANGEFITEQQLANLITHLDMYECLAASRHESHKHLSTAYFIECGEIKRGQP